MWTLYSFAPPIAVGGVIHSEWWLFPDSLGTIKWLPSNRRRSIADCSNFQTARRPRSNRKGRRRSRDGASNICVIDNFPLLRVARHYVAFYPTIAGTSLVLLVMYGNDRVFNIRLLPFPFLDISHSLHSPVSSCARVNAAFREARLLIRERHEYDSCGFQLKPLIVWLMKKNTFTKDGVFIRPYQADCVVIDFTFIVV